MMKRRELIGMAALIAMTPHVPGLAKAPWPKVEVYKSPYCGCCGAWVDHMKAAGFPVVVHEVDDPGVMRKKAGLPDRFASCHTALVGPYVLEGHVPAAEVKRLLASRPAALGLAVPDMPAGSPGMEMGPRQDPYVVYLIDRLGRETAFARYPKA